MITGIIEDLNSKGFTLDNADFKVMADHYSIMNINVREEQHNY